MQQFIFALKRMNITIKLVASDTLSFSNFLTNNEIDFLNELLKGPLGLEKKIISGIRKFLNSGDIFTAEYLVEHGLQYFDNFENKYANIIGTIKNCVDKPIEAEYYYSYFHKNAKGKDFVKSYYPLSMLYLRHHKKNKLNFNKDKKLLTDAYQCILNGALDEQKPTEKIFYTVFNRNGYALVLFREGKINEATELLENSLKKLSTQTKKHFMHKSVIIYNLCQCYRKLKNYDKAIQYYQILLEYDYSFPEYHLELALCFLDKKDIVSYKLCLENALSINKYHADTHYYYSLLYIDDDLSRAEHHAKLAWEIMGDDITAYNYAYIQSLTGNYKNLNKLLPSKHRSILADWLILKAEEKLLVLQNQAINFLQKIKNFYPDNSAIINNLSLLKSQI